MRILAVSGSLRGGSHNTNLLRAAVDAAPQGVEVELFDAAGIAELPLYDQDLDTGDVPRSVARLREEWGKADAILFATPEYNGSVPGGLKNAVDWASRPRLEAALTNKTVAARTGETGAEARRHRRKKPRRHAWPARNHATAAGRNGSSAHGSMKR